MATRQLSKTCHGRRAYIVVVIYEVLSYRISLWVGHQSPNFNKSELDDVFTTSYYHYESLQYEIYHCGFRLALHSPNSHTFQPHFHESQHKVPHPAALSKHLIHNSIS